MDICCSLKYLSVAGLPALKRSMKDNPFYPDLLERLPTPPRKIALLRPSRIGDFLCAVPAIRALRARLPGAQIHMITVPLLQEVAARLPCLDRVWPFPGFPGLAEQLFDARSAVDFLQQAQQEDFDLAIQMQGTGVYSNPFTLLLGARATAGFIRPGDSPGLLDAALPYPHHVHEIHCVLSLMNFLGAPSAGEELEFPLTQTELDEAGRLLAAWPRPWMGLHPSARDQKRRWPLERFASLAAELQSRLGGTIVLLGDTEALPGNHLIIQRLNAPCLDLTGKLSLTMLGALIAQISVLVTNDSGPAHIAYALRARVVTIFGSSSSPQTNGPLQSGPFRLLTPDSTEEAASSLSGQAAPLDIQRISVAHVASAVDNLLEQTARHSHAHRTSKFPG